METDVLATIHGIHSKGEWHDKIAEALEPHFECKKIEYFGYRYLGALVVAGIPLGTAITIVSIGLMLMGLIQVMGWVFLLLSTLGVGLATVAGMLRRRAERIVVDGLIAAKGDRPRAPHLIGHSFGTYLSCWALHDYDIVRFDRMILVGCVLPLTFPWGRILDEKPTALSHLRHEVGRDDWVVALAGLLGRIHRRIGYAGRWGFSVLADVVHDRFTWKYCNRCKDDGIVPIHNFHQNTKHWIDFFQRGYPREIWLPFLWGYEPRDFDEYRKLCHAGFAAITEGFDRQADRIELSFRQQRWSWTNNQSCEAHLAEIADAYFKASGRQAPDDMRPVLRDAIFRIWTMHFAASREWARRAGQRDDDTVRRMKPEWLFEEAVKLAVQ